ncbi:hypothetical protein IMZ48_46300 [Candidatus Bathyarchaeota archaeon]|nr:hypothetical protein [Candidatus Bathyarchaeota archaeon]
MNRHPWWLREERHTGCVITRFHPFFFVFAPVLTTLNISSSLMPFTLGSGTLNLAAFSFLLFLMALLSALADAGLLRSSRYAGTASPGTASSGAALTLRSSCCRICFFIWIFSFMRFCWCILARRPRRFCASLEPWWPWRAVRLRCLSS